MSSTNILLLFSDTYSHKTVLINIFSSNIFFAEAFQKSSGREYLTVFYPHQIWVSGKATWSRRDSPPTSSARLDE